MVELSLYGESMETSIKWSNVRKLIKSLEDLWKSEIHERKLEPLQCQLGYRISQIYHDGVCFYLYFAVTSENVDDTLKHVFELKSLVMDTIIACGGSISHHHGIGKKYKDKYLQFASSNKVEMNILRMVKRELDPKNIFACGNCFSGTNDDAYAKLKHKL